MSSFNNYKDLPKGTVMVCIRKFPEAVLTVNNRYTLYRDYRGIINYVVIKNDNGVTNRFLRDLFITEEEYRILTINNIINEES